MMWLNGGRSSCSEGGGAPHSVPIIYAVSEKSQGLFGNVTGGGDRREPTTQISPVMDGGIR